MSVRGGGEVRGMNRDRWRGFDLRLYVLCAFFFGVWEGWASTRSMLEATTRTSGLFALSSGIIHRNSVEQPPSYFAAWSCLVGSRISIRTVLEGFTPTTPEESST